MPPWLAALVAFAAGALLGEGAAPRMWASTAVVYVVALVVAVEPARHGGSARLGSLVGLASGIGFGLSTLRWVVPSMVRFVDASVAYAVAVDAVTILVDALPPAVGCALYVRVASRSPSALAFASSIALAFTVVPVPFPWRPFAMMVDIPEVAAWLGIGGGTLGDLVLVLPVAYLVVHARSSRDVLAVALVVASLVVVGAWRVRSLTTIRASSRTVRVTAIQPNVSIDVGTDPHARAGRLAFLRGATERAAARGAELVLWPESTHPYVLRRDLRADLPPPHDTRSTLLRIGVVAGAMTESAPCRRWNGVVAFDGRGRVRGRVDKQRRMPFADFIPFAEWWSDDARCRGLEPSVDPEPIVAFDSLGTLVCYDEGFRGPAFDRARDGARFLASFTNDAWYVATRQPYLQEQVARARAIETGLDLVRAVNTGRSSHVSADGRILARLGDARRGHLDVEVPLRETHAIAVVLAPFVDLAVALSLLVVAFAQRRGKSSSGGGR